MMMTKPRVKYPVIVEGRYDKAKLSSILDAQIIATDGFGIYRDPEKLAYLRRLAGQGKVILLTDSDRAGFRIRGYLAGAIPADRLVQLYIPEISGKERRKEKPSAEGTLGVEGIPSDLLIQVFRTAGVLTEEDEPIPAPVTTAQLFALGLTGGPNSASLRRRLQQRLGLPQKLSSGALGAVLPRFVTLPQLEALVRELSHTP